MTVHPISAATTSKAARLLRERRVTPLGEDRLLVKGDHDAYICHVVSEADVDCDCPARTPWCSHALAALAVWKLERERAAAS